MDSVRAQMCSEICFRPADRGGLRVGAEMHDFDVLMIHNVPHAEQGPIHGFLECGVGLAASTGQAMPKSNALAKMAVSVAQNISSLFFP